MHSIRTAGLLVIQEKKLLLAYSRNKQAFYLPGGKANPHETSLEALMREVDEELHIKLDQEHTFYYKHITAPAFGEASGMIMEQDCFISDLKEIPKPDAEIEMVKYFDRNAYAQEPQQVPGVLMIMQELSKDRLID
ncbi:MAG: NUDIX domain-containing protein [Chitinophagales bacterium]